MGGQGTWNGNEGRDQAYVASSSYTAFKASISDTIVGGTALVTGDAGRALGDRAVQMVENQTGQAFTGTVSDWGQFGTAVGGDPAGTNQIVEGAGGYDLATFNELSGQERVQRTLSGVGTVAGNLAGGLSLAVKAPGMLPKLSKLGDASVLGGSANEIRQCSGPNCFVEGTPLLTPDGPKAIEAFERNDLILSRSEDDPEGPLLAKRVEEVFIRKAFLMNLRAGNQVIGTTAEHPFCVEGEGWTPCGRLQPGNVLIGEDGRRTEVEVVQDTGEFVTVYNLRVEDYHTYFVGDRTWGFSVWAHNADYQGAVNAPNSGNPNLAGKTPLSGTRGTGVKRAAKAEVDLVKQTGKGTVDWTPEEISYIKAEGRLPQGAVGHHIDNVDQFLDWAGDPRNIKLVRGQAGYLAEHGGKLQNPTTGPLIDR